MPKADRSPRMNENLSVRLLSNERHNIEAALSDIDVEELPSLSTSDFMRLSSRILLQNVYALGYAISASLKSRRLNADDNAMATRYLQAYALRMLLCGEDVSLLVKRHEFSKRSLWLWCLSEGTLVRWGAIPATRGVSFEQDIQYKKQLASGDPLAFAEFCEQHHLGNVFLFGASL